MPFAPSKMRIESPAFVSLGPIPKKYTADGGDHSPPLEWNDVPSGVRSFALICHDPDAPKIGKGSYGFVHWVLYNIPGNVRSLGEDDNRFTFGVNDAGTMDYVGPGPPRGHGRHHYFFSLIALSKELNLPEGMTLWELTERIEPYVLAVNRLMGTYER
ncbi:MAG: hypothetical protein PWQ88_1097 [Candidatus Methanomethylophilaceae archaeon]|nr:MAG: Phospholipid-binding protein, PBP family [Methanomicrobiales archaeon 53_19]MDI3483226.1 hypothetical protein [Candidatus Methanomethylophilaceae archaeon]MDI3542366.1 hypothetical protein [Candidatus Methanomethylophilaceae archaeon]